MKHWLDDVHFDAQGLIPVIAQDHASGRVLMVAWMNPDTLAETAQRNEAVYWSRSRQQRWHKGESSGHTQTVHEIRLDCDGDVIVLNVTQQGGIACHTGREACFYRVLGPDGWQTVDPVLKDPAAIYGQATTHSGEAESGKAPEQQTQALETQALQHQEQQVNASAVSMDSLSEAVQLPAADILDALGRLLHSRKQADPSSSYVASLYHKGLNKILEKVGEEAIETVLAAKDATIGATDDLVYETADLWFHTLVMLGQFNIPPSHILSELSRRFGLSGLEEKASRTA